MSSVVLLLPVSQVEVSEGRAVVTASVTNAGAESERIVLGCFPPDGVVATGSAPHAAAWTTVDQAVREIAAGATEQYTITVAPPPRTAAGHYPVRFIAYSAEAAPEENADQAGDLDVVVPGAGAEPVAARPRWWIFAVAGALVLVVAVVAFLVIPRPPPSTTPTPAPPSSSPPPPTPPGVVEAFSLADYATESQGVPGASQRLPVGRYDDIESQLTVGNDQISSLKVPRGLVVRAWEHAWFQGAFIDFIADTPAVPAEWDNRISSVIVFEAAAGPPRIEYAVGLDYPWARWLLLPVGDYPDLARTPLGADTMSTILVPRGVKVTVWDDVNFAGASTELTNDHLDLAEWSNRAGSLKVTLA